MVTMKQLKEGAAMYIEKEIADKTPGLRKWLVMLSTCPMIDALEALIEEHRATLETLGYIHKDGMINDDLFFSELAEIARKEGEVTEHFPLLGDITFSESDIKKLHQYVG